MLYIWKWICKLRSFSNREFTVCTLFFNIAKDQKQGPQIGKAACAYLVRLLKALTYDERPKMKRDTRQKSSYFPRYGFSKLFHN